ncbi:hypothetical protein niasHT_031567 [Heterodera trifolii]|uniref:Uncharacterized protein n=1 Tax=Heterodera trifolii TaxID=157864 RepID=A0ABD2IXM8_9BILA
MENAQNRNNLSTQIYAIHIAFEFLLISKLSIPFQPHVITNPTERGENKLSATITVQFIEETALEPDLYRTKLAVLSRNGTMYVHHFHWRRWPDRGVPQNDLAPLRLLFHVQQFRRSVVHCSAGIGRTGTLVALHIAYDTLQRGQRLNILALARNLRQHRAQSVQTLDQYLYIYFVILRYAQNKAAKLNIDERALHSCGRWTRE